MSMIELSSGFQVNNLNNQSIVWYTWTHSSAIVL